MATGPARRAHGKRPPPPVRVQPHRRRHANPAAGAAERGASMVGKNLVLAAAGVAGARTVVGHALIRATVNGAAGGVAMIATTASASGGVGVSGANAANRHRRGGLPRTDQQPLTAGVAATHDGPQSAFPATRRSATTATSTNGAVLMLRRMGGIPWRMGRRSSSRSHRRTWAGSGARCASALCAARTSTTTWTAQLAAAACRLLYPPAGANQQVMARAFQRRRRRRQDEEDEAI